MLVTSGGKVDASFDHQDEDEDEDDEKEIVNCDGFSLILCLKQMLFAL